MLPILMFAQRCTNNYSSACFRRTISAIRSSRQVPALTGEITPSSISSSPHSSPHYAAKAVEPWFFCPPGPSPSIFSCKIFWTLRFILRLTHVLYFRDHASFHPHVFSVPFRINDRTSINGACISDCLSYHSRLHAPPRQTPGAYCNGITASLRLPRGTLSINLYKRTTSSLGAKCVNK
jgi:hypothetical protein